MISNNSRVVRTPGKFFPSALRDTKRPKLPQAAWTQNQLNAKTMECKALPKLYFIGEVVDVTGHLGGFNFQWAWASGFSAGQIA